ncbi:ethylene-responsive transcription factor ERF020-like [Nymphaea colorata]|nr:ethylene-responsive transcription factor ERF020-like [Nymphaea colorata]
MMERGNGKVVEDGGRKPYKGVRRRKWGKWVSEIRLPGSRDRLWLGSYATPEAAAIARDTAVFCLRGPNSVNSLNFPYNIPAIPRLDMSPRSVRRVAAEAGVAMDVELSSKLQNTGRLPESGEGAAQECLIWDGLEDLPRSYYAHQLREEELSISVDDMHGNIFVNFPS